MRPFPAGRQRGRDRAYVSWLVPILLLAVALPCRAAPEVDLEALFAPPSDEEQASVWDSFAPEVIGEDLQVGQLIRGAPTWAAYEMNYKSGELTLQGLVILPAKKGEHPVLIANHAGLNGLVLDSRYTALAHQGYVVVASAYRGEWGIAAVSSGEVQVAEGEVDDVLALVTAARELKAADRTRFGMIGAGHGAWITNLALLRTKDLRAAVSFYGVSDCFDADTFGPLIERNMMRPPRAEASPLTYLVDRWLTGPLREGAMTLAQAREAMLRRSPLYFAQHAQCPLLLIHGEQDEVVPVAQSEKWAAALQQAGKKCELVTYPGQGHGFDRWPSRASREAWRRVMAFLDEHVKHAGKKAKDKPLPPEVPDQPSAAPE